MSCPVILVIRKVSCPAILVITQTESRRCRLSAETRARAELSVWREVSVATCQSGQSDAGHQLQPRGGGGGPLHRAVHLLLRGGVQADDQHRDQHLGDIHPDRDQ